MVRFARFALASFVACATTKTVAFDVPSRPSDTEGTVRTIAPGDCSTTSRGCATLTIENEMSSRFILEATHASIDDQTILTQSGAPIDALAVPITAGRHELIVDLTFHYEHQCVYCYVRAWKFVVHGKHTFDVPDGTNVELHAIAYERGGVTTPFEERPAMRFTDTNRPR